MSNEKKLTDDYIPMREEIRQQILEDEINDPVLLVEKVYQLWWRWADFELYIINPVFEVFSPARIIKPEPVEGFDEQEFVYDIHDSGHKMSTSKASDMYSAGMSMCKLFYTIEKMIFMLVERLKAGGVDMETEVQVAFGGHEIAQRKAFESIINLSYNVVVTNFEPGNWGEQYLDNVKRISAKGYGYPNSAPRDNFRLHHGSIPTSMGKR